MKQCQALSLLAFGILPLGHASISIEMNQSSAEIQVSIPSPTAVHDLRTPFEAGGDGP
jgi:hypothetical protein